MYVDPTERRRQRDRERYAQDKDEILSRQRQYREHKKAATALMNVTTTELQTQATVPSGVTQLQQISTTGGVVP